MSAPVELLETLRWTPGEGYFLLEEHLARAQCSAAHFGIRLEADRLRAALEEAVGRCAREPQRVRLVVGAGGAPRVEAVPLSSLRLPEPLRVALATDPVDPADPRLYHKTTDRTLYQRARADHPGMDDVLLVNTRGEITESTIANVVVERDGLRVTPPVCAGLLPGLFRAHLLATGAIHEGTIPRSELGVGSTLFLINSVREWMPAEVVEAG